MPHYCKRYSALVLFLRMVIFVLIGYVASTTEGVSGLRAQVIEDSKTEAVIGSSAFNGFDQAAVFEEVWTHVDQYFFDPKFAGVDWPQAKTRYRRRAEGAASLDEFAEVINEMLGELKTSHTGFFARSNPRYFQLLGIFHAVMDGASDADFCYEGIGILTRKIEGQHFVSALYDGCAAEKSGVRFGDEIVSVGGKPFHPIESFRGQVGFMVALEIRREPAEPTQQFLVPVENHDGRTMFLDALKASAKKIDHRGRTIGYLHVWSYAGSQMQDAIRDLIIWGELSDADGLILDLRGGWGGASLEYVNLFRPAIAAVQSRNRGGEARNFAGVWGKPVVLIVDRESTSGKELFTFGFKKLRLGAVVGTTTAGAVVAGRIFRLSSGDLLYVAVNDITVDGERLEARGVEPTLSVDRPLPYAQGRDPQLEQALEMLAGAGD